MMTMIVLDTNVVSEIACKQHPNSAVVAWVERQLLRNLFTTSITIAELLYGVALLDSSHRRSRLEASIESFADTLADRTLTFDAEAAAYYAIIAAGRRRDGRPIGVQDAMIAAIARAHGASVATRNVKDFEGTGVDVINPWEEVA
ncbi:type II toxin-antitoxin system VapC family toxin [Bifidobacterium leontopitheci]|uniref:Ribonuclease VapC n=1 Tax=Bifidobacterium leontopitheci TaxID=2650774 RepID=A0A6I1GVE2_9BIFI|nr:type II toxin-antitoxin system VapC family toxin [Bifidobacterium leontopitheci]KAB7790421.1 PIN domain-containing protein [Bifidobacterium leontopitheci]